MPVSFVGLAFLFLLIGLKSASGLILKSAEKTAQAEKEKHKNLKQGYFSHRQDTRFANNDQNLLAPLTRSGYLSNRVCLLLHVGAGASTSTGSATKVASTRQSS